MKDALLRLLFDTSLKARILQAHQNSLPTARQQELSDREMLTLEIAEAFGPVSERDLRSIFGLSAASVSQMVTGLSKERRLIEKGEGTDADGRIRPLTLTKAGKEMLSEIKASHAKRFEYLFSTLTDPSQLKVFEQILTQIGDAATKQVKERVFNIYE